ncbi:succinyldiaminopimelate transaminase [Citricoccus sp. SGAir0253]|uniref:succinyldiaminopimelate transaminase n=1 Tax=Citricoccus sp. SGAir0253 TaxID=2567881 RepID=UPI0010CD031B|nr:succinyldiaminopimelate transaminase [Citricoccus sp. SGAir0253]QCU77687.1 succinyldiaminopimelate transaminase [Citricoccus sp. SGAir0253]
MLTLPEYPWESLAPYRRTAQAHPGGICDLSIGTPVDDTPELIQRALADAANAHGYPTTHGTPALREAIAGWFGRRRGVPGLDPQAVIPTVGSKEFIAWLPLLLGIGPGDVVVRPTVAYPTYDIGALLVGAEAVAADSLDELDAATRARVRLVWTNSPGNPTGRVAPAAELRAVVDQARALGAVVAGDECYAELGWEQWDHPGSGTPCILAPEVSGGDHTGLLSVYSLSKQSNLAGYRAAFAAGDPAIVANLVNSRKHAGMIVPAPVQAAMTVALQDDAHVAAQKDRYRARRALLKDALAAAGLVVDHSEAGLYLWTRDGDRDGARDGSPAGPGTPPAPTPEDSWALVGRLAEQGILAGPGTFYGAAGNGYARVAITATDEAVARAAERLHALR